MKTRAVRLYGVNDLKLKESELPEFQRKILMKDNEAFIIYSESQQIVGNGFYIYG